MIAVLGSQLDEATRGLVKAWSTEGAVLLSAKDLCTRGWVFQANSDCDGSFVAGGIQRPIATLCGVVVRRPAVVAEELPWIAPEDRHYVAAEINAFLVSWLSALRCPVLNRPTATSLCGPAWSQTYWQVYAARAGIAWADPVERDTLQDVVFCGRFHHGVANKHQVRLGIKLTTVSGADLMGVQFAGDKVAAVTLLPRLAEQVARDIVLEYLKTTVQA